MIWVHDLGDLPTPKMTAFSFGGGVQSTALMMLLKHKPEIFTAAGMGLPSVAFWADTGAEVSATNKHVELLISMGLPIPLKIVRAKKNGGDLSQLGKPPWKLLAKDGSHGMSMRSCTDRWKIEPLQKAMREAIGVKKYKRMPPKSVHLWIGISRDEIQRAGMSKVRGFVNLYPLLEIGWSRADCLGFLRETLPREVPKSACYFCPFRSPNSWLEMKRNEPEDFERACAIDEFLRSDDMAGVRELAVFKSKPFIHSARIPLADAVAAFEEDKIRKMCGQTPLFEEFDDWDNECSGLCGL